MRRWSWRLGAALAVALVSIGVCDAWVDHSASARCFESISEVPRSPVALVLGCSEFLPDGRRNLYFTRRVEAAARLFRAGRVGALIVSGDNHAADYDEPTALKDALVRLGVPVSAVYCDFAGFRTLDSVVRAEAVFGQREFTVVSQRFHCERAVFLARARGLEAHGFAADPVGGTAGARTRLRESLARAAAVLDAYVLGTEPRFLGPRVEIELALVERR